MTQQEPTEKTRQKKENWTAVLAVLVSALVAGAPTAQAVIEITSDGEETSHVAGVKVDGLASVDELLGFATNPNVDECNTFSVDSWYVFGHGDQIEGARHNGVHVAKDTLSPSVFPNAAGGPSAQGDDDKEKPDGTAEIVKAFASVLNKCAGTGGAWCACLVKTDKVLVFCAACCKNSTYQPFCSCSMGPPSAVCGCFRDPRQP